jgi:hypothetical protein
MGRGIGLRYMSADQTGLLKTTNKPFCRRNFIIFLPLAPAYLSVFLTKCMILTNCMKGEKHVFPGESKDFDKKVWILLLIKQEPAEAITIMYATAITYYKDASK